MHIQTTTSDAFELLAARSFHLNVTPQKSVAQLEVLHTIARLARQTERPQGWILIIAPPCAITKKMLEQLNVNSHRIMMIHQHQINRFDDLMRDALTGTTCSAVLSFMAETQPEMEDYRYLSAKYGTTWVNIHACTAASAWTH